MQPDFEPNIRFTCQQERAKRGDKKNIYADFSSNKMLHPQYNKTNPIYQVACCLYILDA